MSMLPPDASPKKKSRVKVDQNFGVDINRLVASQSARITPPPAVYQDRTLVPACRQDAHVAFQARLANVPTHLQGVDPKLLAALPNHLQALLMLPAKEAQRLSEAPPAVSARASAQMGSTAAALPASPAAPVVTTPT